ncbi:MAG: hypothetical protein JW841_15725 [Deltaproteobacteria bacterium]|nr:hypothetical protein [Deltaproteobacteria bacterium]
MMHKLLLVVICFTIGACESFYPEVVIVNKTAAPILLRNISYNGCLWESVSQYEEVTSVQKCMPGSDHVYFQKFNALTYYKKLVEDDLIDDFNTETYNCDDVIGECPVDENITSQPVWYNYRTSKRFAAKEAGFYTIEIYLEDFEQDFSVPGPYGH